MSLLHEPVLSAMRWYTDRVAIVGEDGRTTTFSELQRHSAAWSARLSQCKSSRRRSSFVGLLAPVDADSIAAVIGALAAGFTYVPLDEQSPTECLLGVVERTGIDVIVADSTYLARHSALVLAPTVTHVLLTSEVLGDSGRPPAPVILGDDLAYVLHSSGPVGVPQGIMLSHRNARTFTDWVRQEIRVDPDDVVMSRAPWTCDLSVCDVFNTLSAGAQLVVFDWTRERASDARLRDYVALMVREAATILYTTPSTLRALLNHGGLWSEAPPLRTVMYAGEPFPTAHLRRLQRALPGAHVANLYGSMETNIITCQWVSEELLADDSPVPIGREVDGTEIIVVSEDGRRLCQPGEIGELWCRGGTVTAGYVGMPEETAERCVESPFHLAPVRFWRTGDLGFRDPDGVLHYRGRRDDTVTVRGERVELGEIESVLARYPELGEAAVVAVPDIQNGTGSVLACYFAPLPGQQVSEEDVWTFLDLTVSEYLVPRLVQRREWLPKTSSGTIDRVALQGDARDRMAGS